MNIEKYLLQEAAALLVADKAEIESVTGPILLTVEGGAVKIADGVFAKLPFGLAGLADAALKKYVAQYGSEADLEQYEGKGIDELAAIFNKIAAGL